MTRLVLLAATAMAWMTACSTAGGDSAAGAAATPSASAPTTVFNCGGRRVVVTADADFARIQVDNQSFDMKPVRVASGARYEMPGNAATSFWNKGERATLTVGGRAYAECVQSVVTLPLRASGNEPSWRLDITDSTMTLLADLGARRVVTGVPAKSRTPDATVFTGAAAAGAIAASVVDRVCKDKMSGMPFPYTVDVREGGEVLRGCGGEPAALLRIREWVVEDLDGRGIIDRSRLTLDFDVDGRVSGLAGCNRYSGRYALSGEGLRISDVVTTRKTCAASLMEQEARFVSTLGATQRFDITPDGALRLIADDPRSVTAR